MLVSNLDTLKKYVPTVMGNNFERYRIYLQTADEYLVTDLIGQALYNKVIAAGADQKLLDYCQHIAALKGYLDAIPFLDLVETETGFGVVSSGDGSTVPASTARVNSLTKGIETRLSVVIDNMLEYLEGNADFYDDWKLAKTYSVNHDSFIFTLTQFRNYARYDGTRIEWISDISKVTRAMRINIEPIISSALSAAITTQLIAGSLNDANKKIIESLRFALAAFVTGDITTGNNLVFGVRNIILKTVDDYPEFKASDIYLAIQAAKPAFSMDQSIASFGI